MPKKLLWVVSAAVSAAVLFASSGCNPQCVDVYDCRSLGTNYYCNNSNQCVPGATCPDGGTPGADGGC
jgi:hypothetical protein